MMRKVLKNVLFAIFTIAIFVNDVHGQFLNMENPSYLNFGWVDYRNYRANVPIYPQFDYFGNFMVEGFDAFNWEEYRTIRPQSGSVLMKGSTYQQWLNHLVIARDAFAGWSSCLMVGDAINLLFTPLTFNQTRYNGVVWDVASDNNRFTVVGSRTSDPEKLWYLRPLGGNLIRKIDEGAYTLGGHWETFVGGFLRLGATYLNIHRFDSFRSSADNSWQGVTPREAVPDTLYVRFSDDSPADGIAGAAVYYIYANVKIKSGGKVYTQRIEPMRIIRSTGVVEHPPGYLQPGGYLEASGEFQAPTKFYDGVYKVPVYVDFVFPMPESVFEAEFTALVANDYRISIRQAHHFIEKTKLAEEISVQEEPQKSRPFFPYFPIRVSEGNVRDMTNKKIVRFQYGMLSGMSTMGLDAEITIGGFHLKGEIVKSSTNFQYPVLIGKHSDYKDYASYITAKQDLKSFTIGGEWFYLGPKYHGYYNGQDARYLHAGMLDKYDPTIYELEYERYLFHAARGPFWYYNDARQAPVAKTHDDYLYNPVYSFVDDNDDNDVWPDDWKQDWGADTPEQFFEQSAGIFPGMDKDGNSVPDYNRNNNLIPDWDEPFLQYYSEPLEFQYGDDNNNNFIIDAWEDDMLPDYPYYKDETGKNFYVTFSPTDELHCIWGTVNINRIAGGGNNKTQYMKLNFSHSLANKGEIWFEHNTKRVKDNIRNDWYRFEISGEESLGEKTRYEQTLNEDLLSMRNSLVNRGYLSTRFSPIPNLNIINNVRYEINKQYADIFDDGTSQNEDRIDFIGIVNKADYTYKWKKLLIMPQAKLQYQRWNLKTDEHALVDNLLFIPIMRFEYPLTKRTVIHCGVQGFPLVSNRYWDRVDAKNNYSANNFMIYVSNVTPYQGYKVCTQVGWQYKNIDFYDSYRRDVDYYMFFVRAIAGIE